MNGKAAILNYTYHGDLHPNEVADPDCLKVALIASPAPHIPRHVMAIPPRKMNNLNNLKNTRPPKTLKNRGQQYLASWNPFHSLSRSRDEIHALFNLDQYLHASTRPFVPVPGT
jgi:hypothetical protein